MSNKRITIHLTALEAMAVGMAVSNMLTGDGDDGDGGNPWGNALHACNRVKKKILEARRKRNDTTDDNQRHGT